MPTRLQLPDRRRNQEFRSRAFIEKKEIKKMGRFIQFAIAASEFALNASSG